MPPMLYPIEHLLTSLEKLTSMLALNRQEVQVVQTFAGTYCLLRPKLSLLNETGCGAVLRKVVRVLPLCLLRGPLVTYVLTCLVPLMIPFVTKWLPTLHFLVSGPQKTCFPSVLTSLLWSSLDKDLTQLRPMLLQWPSDVDRVLLGALMRATLPSENVIGRLKTLVPMNCLLLVCLTVRTLCFEVLTTRSPMPVPVPRPLQCVMNLLQWVPNVPCRVDFLLRHLVLQAQSCLQVLCIETHVVTPLCRLPFKLSGRNAVLQWAMLPRQLIRQCMFVAPISMNEFLPRRGLNNLLNGWGRTLLLRSCRSLLVESPVLLCTRCLTLAT